MIREGSRGDVEAATVPSRILNNRSQMRFQLQLLLRRDTVHVREPLPILLGDVVPAILPLNKHGAVSESSPRFIGFRISGVEGARAGLDGTENGCEDGRMSVLGIVGVTLGSEPGSESWIVRGKFEAGEFSPGTPEIGLGSSVIPVATEEEGGVWCLVLPFDPDVESKSAHGFAHSFGNSGIVGVHEIVVSAVGVGEANAGTSRVPVLNPDDDENGIEARTSFTRVHRSFVPELKIPHSTSAGALDIKW